VKITLSAPYLTHQQTGSFGANAQENARLLPPYWCVRNIGRFEGRMAEQQSPPYSTPGKNRV
jgi:hypothetical protein